MSRNGTFGSVAPIRTPQSMPADAKPKPVQKTSAGLREILFDSIEKVRAGDMDHMDAKAVAALSQQICNTVSLEIEVAKLRTSYPADAKLIVPSPLVLGLSEPDKNQ